jgi:pimeloyl-ACP methyl ester carboxylesterase
MNWAAHYRVGCNTSDRESNTHADRGDWRNFVKTDMSKKIIIVAVVLLTAGDAAVARAQDSVPPIGRRVDIGGYSLHLHCTGRGSPAVILMHGFNDYSFIWQLVQPEVAKFTLVCSYDRAGQAWSDPGPAPRGLQRISDELFRLLGAASIDGPYVLVGHSWGGLIPRIFAHDHQASSAGIVFVDASHEDNYLGIRDTVVQPRAVPDSVWQRIWPSAHLRDSAALPSFQPPALSSVQHPYDLLHADAQGLFKWARSRPVYYQNGDWGDIREDMRVANRLSPAGSLGRIPVIVLSGGRRSDTSDHGVSAESRRSQFEMNQRALSLLSRNRRHIWAMSSGHHIHLEEPDLVVEAIKQVVTAARTGAPLCCQPN